MPVIARRFGGRMQRSGWGAQESKRNIVIQSRACCRLHHSPVNAGGKPSGAVRFRGIPHGAPETRKAPTEQVRRGLIERWLRESYSREMPAKAWPDKR